MAAPMLHNPVGCLVSDLPFVNDRAQTRACEVIRRKIVMSTKTAMKSTVMLHLRARNGPVLLEMLADALGAEFEDAAIVLTGRALESDMAGLLFSSDDSGNGDDDRASGSMFSEISSLTTSGIGSHSTIPFHSIPPTMPTLNAPDDDDRVGSCTWPVPGISSLTTMQTLDASKVGGSSSMPSIVLRRSTIKDAPPAFKFDERAGVGANAVVSEASAKRASTVAPEASAASAVTVASEGSAARGVNLLLMRPVHEAK